MTTPTLEVGMKRVFVLGMVNSAIFAAFVFVSNPDVSQARPPNNPNPDNNGNLATTVNPPGLAPKPPGWSELPPAFRNDVYPPGFGGTPLGQRGTPPPGQTQTPP